MRATIWVVEPHGGGRVRSTHRLFDRGVQHGFLGASMGDEMLA